MGTTKVYPKRPRTLGLPESPLRDEMAVCYAVYVKAQGVAARAYNAWKAARLVHRFDDADPKVKAARTKTVKARTKLQAAKAAYREARDAARAV